MAAATRPRLTPGSRVQVRCHEGCPWMDGFVIDSLVAEPEPGYRVARPGDGLPLPVAVPVADVRALP